MREADTKPDLNQLIQDAHQGVAKQQAATAAAANQAPRPSHAKTILGYVLLVVLAVVVFFQYPRINAPYIWPDAASSPAAAEADLEAVIDVIETYRISQGRYPAKLSDIRLPTALAQSVEGTTLDYAPSDKGYTLTWQPTGWLAAYSSETGKVSVAPAVKR